MAVFAATHHAEFYFVGGYLYPQGGEFFTFGVVFVAPVGVGGVEIVYFFVEFVDGFFLLAVGFLPFVCEFFLCFGGFEHVVEVGCEGFGFGFFDGGWHGEERY